MKKLDMGVEFTPEEDRALREALGLGTPIDARPRPFSPFAVWNISCQISDAIGIIPAIVICMLVEQEDLWKRENDPKGKKGYFVLDVNYISNNTRLPLVEVLRVKKLLIDRKFLVKVGDATRKDGTVEERFTIPDQFECRN